MAQYCYLYRDNPARPAAPDRSLAILAVSVGGGGASLTQPFGLRESRSAEAASPVERMVADVARLPVRRLRRPYADEPSPDPSTAAEHAVPQCAEGARTARPRGAVDAALEVHEGRDERGRPTRALAPAPSACKRLSRRQVLEVNKPPRHSARTRRTERPVGRDRQTHGEQHRTLCSGAPDTSSSATSGTPRERKVPHPAVPEGCRKRAHEQGGIVSQGGAQHVPGGTGESPAGEVRGSRRAGQADKGREARDRTDGEGGVWVPNMSRGREKNPRTEPPHEPPAVHQI